MVAYLVVLAEMDVPSGAYQDGAPPSSGVIERVGSNTAFGCVDDDPEHGDNSIEGKERDVVSRDSDEAACRCSCRCWRPSRRLPMWNSFPSAKWLRDSARDRWVAIVGPGSPGFGDHAVTDRMTQDLPSRLGGCVCAVL
jgi:hypothetical protein